MNKKKEKTTLKWTIKNVLRVSYCIWNKSNRAARGLKCVQSVRATHKDPANVPASNPGWLMASIHEDLPITPNRQLPIFYYTDMQNPGLSLSWFKTILFD